jgi:heat shock protein HslJ
MKYILAAAILSAGLGCGFLQQGGSMSNGVPLPEKTAGALEPPPAAQRNVAPERLVLTGKEWSWIRTVYNNDTIIVPAKPGVFTLTFNSDGTVNAVTDCNRMRGSYSVEGRLLSFGDMAATRMYCPDSQETKFATMLSHVSAFLFTDKGELVLEMKFDTGVILFE